MKESNFISFVGYINAEDDSVIADFLKKISSFGNERFKYYEIILACDNASPEKQKHISSVIKKTQVDSQTTIVYLEHSIGKEKSLVAALDMAIGDYIIEFGSVGYVPEKEKMIDLYYRCMNGYDACILTRKKLTLFGKMHGLIMRKFGYVSIDEYRDDGLVSVLSRRMINRTNSIKRRVTNKWLYYKMSGLPCQYVGCDDAVKVREKRSEKMKMRINTVFVFTSLVPKMFMLLSLMMFVAAVLVMTIGNSMISGCVLISMSVMLFAIVFVMKKQSLSLEYLWSESNYQFSNIEKISKE